MTKPNQSTPKLVGKLAKEHAARQVHQAELEAGKTSDPLPEPSAALRAYYEELLGPSLDYSANMAEHEPDPEHEVARSLSTMAVQQGSIQKEDA